MSNIFKSKYTGEEIERILDNSNNLTTLIPNSTEIPQSKLSTIKIGDTTYSVGLYGLYLHNISIIIGGLTFKNYIIINNKLQYTSIGDFLSDYGAITFETLEALDDSGTYVTYKNAIILPSNKVNYVNVYYSENGSVKIIEIAGSDITDNVTIL